MITTILVKEETFNRLKKNKKVHIQLKSSYDINEKLYVSNRDVTTDSIVVKIVEKNKIRSPLHGKMFLYTIGCK